MFSFHRYDIKLYLTVAIYLWNNLKVVYTTTTVIVQTELGGLNGYTLDVKEHNFNGNDVSKLDMFLGVPYAEPPVGKLRFARPVPKAPWKPNIRDALAFGPSCQQPSWFLQKYYELYIFMFCVNSCLVYFYV